MKERSPGAWWLRAYAGRSSTGKPVQVSRTVHGGERLAQAESAKLVTQVAGRAGEVTPLPRRHDGHRAARPVARVPHPAS